MSSRPQSSSPSRPFSLQTCPWLLPEVYFFPLPVLLVSLLIFLPHLCPVNAPIFQDFPASNAQYHLTAYSVSFQRESLVDASWVKCTFLVQLVVAWRRGTYPPPLPGPTPPAGERMALPGSHLALCCERQALVTPVAGGRPVSVGRAQSLWKGLLEPSHFGWGRQHWPSCFHGLHWLTPQRTCSGLSIKICLWEDRALPEHWGKNGVGASRPRSPSLRNHLTVTTM